MGPRSAVSQLPPADKEWLDQELIRRSFSGYVELAEALKARGYQISKSAVHAYGQDFEERLGTLKRTSEMAKAITEQVGDDAGAVGEALTAIVQDRLFEIAMKLQDADATDVDLVELVRAISSLNRTAVHQKKWASEVRAKARDAAAELDKAIKKPGGLSPEAVDAIRSKILGIAG